MGAEARRRLLGVSGAAPALPRAHRRHAKHRNMCRTRGEAPPDLDRSGLAGREDTQCVRRGGMAARRWVVARVADTKQGVCGRTRGQHHRDRRVQRIARSGAADLVTGHPTDKRDTWIAIHRATVAGDVGEPERVIGGACRCSRHPEAWPQRRVGASHGGGCGCGRRRTRCGWPRARCGARRRCRTLTGGTAGRDLSGHQDRGCRDKQQPSHTGRRWCHRAAPRSENVHVALALSEPHLRSLHAAVA